MLRRNQSNSSDSLPGLEKQILYFVLLNLQPHIHNRAGFLKHYHTEAGGQFTSCSSCPQLMTRSSTRLLCQHYGLLWGQKAIACYCICTWGQQRFWWSLWAGMSGWSCWKRNGRKKCHGLSCHSINHLSQVLSELDQTGTYETKTVNTHWEFSLAVWFKIDGHQYSECLPLPPHPAGQWEGWPSCQNTKGKYAHQSTKAHCRNTKLSTSPWEAHEPASWSQRGAAQGAQEPDINCWRKQLTSSPTVWKHSHKLNKYN